MGGVACFGSDVQISENGPRVLIFGGQRQGISGALWSLEQASGDGYLGMPDGAEGAGPPPAPRTQTTLTSIGTEPQKAAILFAGFALNIGCVNDVWRCTIGLDAASMPFPTWEKIETSGTTPEARYGHSATYLPSKSRIVYFGGQDGLVQFADLHILDPASGAWTQPSVSGPAPSPRMQHSATLVGEKVLLFGGFNKKERCLSDFVMLDLNGDASSGMWSNIEAQAPPGTKAITARSQHSAAATSDGRYVVIFGGYEGFKSLNDLWIYEVPTSSIKQISVEPPMPEARARHAAHMIGDVMHIIGGYDGWKPIGGELYTLDCSDPGAMEGAASGDKKKKEGDDKADKEDDDED